MAIEPVNPWNPYGVNDDRYPCLNSYEIRDLLKPTPPPINYLHYPEFWRELDEDDE